jgi:hypothetical protein
MRMNSAMASPKIAFLAASLLLSLGGIAAAHHRSYRKQQRHRTSRHQRRCATTAGVSGVHYRCRQQATAR